MPIPSTSHPRHAPHPGLRRLLRQAILAGLALLLVWPATRGHSEWLGWGPLWLLGMPLSAWWALHRFALPTSTLRRALNRVRPRVQARRRRRTAPLRLPRAA